MPGRALFLGDALEIYMLIYIDANETRTMTLNMTLSSYPGAVIHLIVS